MDKKPHLRLAITNKCNLSCIYCRPGGEGITSEEIMSFEEVITSLKIASKAGFKFLKITGGEPLLREKQKKDLFKIIRKIKEDSLFNRIEMVTNGVLIPCYAKEIAESGLDSITVSLDTANRMHYKDITLHDCYPSVIEGIMMLKNYGMAINLNAVIGDFNIEDVPKLIELACKLGVDLKLIDFVKFDNTTSISYVSFEQVYSYLETLPHSKTVIYPSGGLGTPMITYVLNDTTKVLIKDARVGTNYNSNCKQCKYYPCQDALISIRVTANGALKKCLIRDDNVISFLTELKTGDYDSVYCKFKKLYDELSDSEYFENAWRSLS